MAAPNPDKWDGAAKLMLFRSLWTHDTIGEGTFGGERQH
jgi:hypothetical protein